MYFEFGFECSLFQIEGEWNENSLICFNNLLVIDGVLNLFMQGGVGMYEIEYVIACCKA